MAYKLSSVALNILPFVERRFDSSTSSLSHAAVGGLKSTSQKKARHAGRGSFRDRQTSLCPWASTSGSCTSSCRQGIARNVRTLREFSWYLRLGE